MSKEWKVSHCDTADLERHLNDLERDEYMVVEIISNDSRNFVLVARKER